MITQHSNENRSILRKFIALPGIDGLQLKTIARFLKLRISTNP
jgi:hypothetical protein